MAFSAGGCGLGCSGGARGGGSSNGISSGRGCFSGRECSSGRGCSSGGGCFSGRGCPSLHVYDWLSESGVGTMPLTFDVVEISFKRGRSGFYKNTAGLEFYSGDNVVVEADRGIDIGTVHMTGELVRIRLKSMNLHGGDSCLKVIRVATATDIESWDSIRESDTDTFLVGRRMIDRLNLPMKLVDVEWQFDRKKVTFYFTAENRVDFRELVRKLASRFRTRVELRQIGARDEAARVGGIGSCGRELCCSTWLKAFKPVSTSSAKLQNLPLNPARLSGQCGRLKCCLNYELEQYMSALEAFPRIDTIIRTSAGDGVVRKIDIFKDVIWLQYANGSWEDKSLESIQTLLPLGEGRVDHGADL